MKKIYPETEYFGLNQKAPNKKLINIFIEHGVEKTVNYVVHLAKIDRNAKYDHAIAEVIIKNVIDIEDRVKSISNILNEIRKLSLENNARQENQEEIELIVNELCHYLAENSPDPFISTDLAGLMWPTSTEAHFKKFDIIINSIASLHDIADMNFNNIAEKCIRLRQKILKARDYDKKQKTIFKLENNLKNKLLILEKDLVNMLSSQASLILDCLVSASSFSDGIKEFSKTNM